MPDTERRKYLLGLIASLLLAVSMSAWGLYQWGGNKTHDMINAKNTEQDRRIDRLEEALDKISGMAADIAQIKGYLEGSKGR